MMLRPKISDKLLLACVIAFGLTLSSCHTTKKIKPQTHHTKVEHLHIGKPTKTQKRIIDEAMTWLGTPYKYAGAEKKKGTDCSGMVLRVYEKVTGESLPRNSAKQAEYCRSIKRTQVEPGDLVFFATGKDPDKISHVGIIIDDDHFIHASSSKGVVISDLTTNYYQRTFKKFGRVPGM